jgi:hypothetical protein
MDLSIGKQVAECVVFGLVVMAGYLLIAGPRRPWPLWEWLAGAWVLAWLCWIVLFGFVTL